MSVHTLAHRSAPKQRFEVGYDRRSRRYFVQIWAESSPDCPVHSDDDLDIRQLESMGAVVPDGLLDLLVKEATGEADAGACIDWREE